MAGHSKFKNIMHRKGAQDAKRAKLFTRVLREVSVAVKEGGDEQEHNPRLRAAIIGCKNANIPKDRIQAAIEKASNPSLADNYEEMRYEGFSPGGAAIIVEALTDNKNRTASEVRSAFSKFGGRLSETGSVSFMFRRVGVIIYPKNAGTDEAFFEAAIESGGTDCESFDECHEITCEPDNFSEVRDWLEKKFDTAESASLSWKPLNLHKINDEDALSLSKLIDALEDCDDVQNVIGNFEISEAAANN